MSYVDISRESSSKLTVEFPSHKSQHEICQGPVTVVTFGQTSTIDTTPQPARIYIPGNRSVIEIYDAEKRLVCSWESIAPVAKDGVRTVAPKLEDTDSEDCVVLFSRKTKRPGPGNARHPLTPEASTTTSSPTSETPQLPLLSPAKQHVPKRDALITPHESPTLATCRSQAESLTQRPDPTPGGSTSGHQSHPPSRSRRTMGIKVPRPRAQRQTQPPSRKTPRSCDSAYTPHAAIHRKETQPATTRPQPKQPKPRPSRLQRPPTTQSPLSPIPNLNLPLTDQQTRFLTKVLKSLSQSIHAAEFLHPVDPIANPTYSTLITTPIDLRTISQKLKSAQYKTLSFLIADIDLMVRNAETFNGAGSEISQDAVCLQEWFRGYLTHFPGKEIDSMEAVDLLFDLGPEEGEVMTVMINESEGRRSVRGTKRAIIDYSMENYFSKKLRLD